MYIYIFYNFYSYYFSRPHKLQSLNFNRAEIKAVNKVCLSANLDHRRKVAAVKVLLKMHKDRSLVDLQALLTPPYERRHTKRTSQSMLRTHHKRHNQLLLTVGAEWLKITRAVIVMSAVQEYSYKYQSLL